MHLTEELNQARLEYVTRRHFLRRCSSGLGALALTSMLGPRAGAGPEHNVPRDLADPMTVLPPHFAPQARRVIYLHMAGSPSQLELFEHKPELKKLDGQKCPQSLLEGKRFAFIQGVPDMLGPQFDFQQHGQCGAWVSDRLPHVASVVDKLTFIKTLHTDQFNHAPAQFLLYSGSPRPGRPAMGSWVTYGLGSENSDLPGFIVLVSGGKTPSAGKTLWGSGFLPSVYQGVQCRSSGDPILYSSNPAGVDRDLRRMTVEAINEVNQRQFEAVGDPEILTRIAQYEMAFRMQVSVPEAMDIGREPESVHQAYGTEPGKNAFANNCLLARRLAERGVRFIQLYDWGWDSHGASKSEALHGGFLDKCRSIDQPIAALLNDLEERGMLDDTLVVWGGEFGRTPMRENRGGRVMEFVGRDHHPYAFTVWMAGGGARAGYTHGETDEIGYYPVRDKVHIHDFQATLMCLLGFNHEKLTYYFQGRDYRLTDVHGKLVPALIT